MKERTEVCPILPFLPGSASVLKQRHCHLVGISYGATLSHKRSVICLGFL